MAIFPFRIVVLVLCILTSAGSSVPRANAQQPASTLAEQIRNLDGGVILRGKLSRNPMAAMLANYVRAELREANRRDRSAWLAIKTKSDWERMRARALKALRASLGQFPPVPKDLRIRTVRTIKGDGFQVDNLIYESRPGVIVTANLYRPVKPSTSMPGLIVCHSHHRSKESGARQLMGATWARAGCVVLVPDHLGHGERRQHPFAKASDYAKPFRVSSQDYYFRYDAGMQLHLIGESLMGWLVWDLSRGVDVLLKQPGVDRKRIIMISEPAGGGDVAAVTAALDERITGVMVNNFGGPEPEDGYPLPPDAETSFRYTSSGSWESTRNLRLSARDGFAPWIIVGSFAPRRFIYYHEFYWDRDNDPVWKRLRKIFGFCNAEGALAGIAGHGFVVGSSPQNTHWTPYSRSLLYPTLERWFHIPNPKREYDKLIPEAMLMCLTAAKANDFKSISLYKLCAQIGVKRVANSRRELENQTPAETKTQLRTQFAALLGKIDIANAPVVRNHDKEIKNGIQIERIQLHTEPGIIVPVLMLMPKTRSPRRIIVAVAQSGKQSFLRHRSQQIAALLQAGNIVCLLDVRGTGETDPGDGRSRRSTATTLSSSELMLGQTLVGARLRDLRQALRYVRGRDDVDAKRIVLWGDSFAPPNAPDCKFAVPHGIAERPHQSEPLGGMLVLLAALFDDNIEAVYVHGGLSSFHDVLASPFCYVPHDVVIPSLLTTGDLCDVAATLAPRPLRLDSLVDGQNRRESVERTQTHYANALLHYRKAKAGRNLVITGAGPSIARWLGSLVNKHESR